MRDMDLHASPPADLDRFQRDRAQSRKHDIADPSGGDAAIERRHHLKRSQQVHFQQVSQPPARRSCRTRPSRAASAVACRTAGRRVASNEEHETVARATNLFGVTSTAGGAPTGAPPAGVGAPRTRVADALVQLAGMLAWERESNLRAQSRTGFSGPQNRVASSLGSMRSLVESSRPGG